MFLTVFTARRPARTRAGRARGTVCHACDLRPSSAPGRQRLSAADCPKRLQAGENALWQSRQPAFGRAPHSPGPKGRLAASGLQKRRLMVIGAKHVFPSLVPAGTPGRCRGCAERPRRKQAVRDCPHGLPQSRKRRSSPPQKSYASACSSSRATMLMILIIGLMAGPAVSL